MRLLGRLERIGRSCSAAFIDVLMVADVLGGVRACLGRQAR